MATQNPIPQRPGTPVQPVAPSIFDSTGNEHHESFEATKADRDALEPGDLIQIFADIHTAATRVLASSLRAKAFDTQLAALPGMVGVRERTEKYAKAASQAQTNYLNAIAPPVGMVELMEQLKQRRVVYLREAQVLIERGILEPKHVEGIDNSPGYREVVYDSMRLCSLLRETFPKIAGKSFVTLEEIVAVSAMVEKAEKMLEIRDDKENARVEANDTRQRAFTLMAKSYDQLLKGLTFVLWETGNLDEIAPTMQVNSRRGRSSGEADVAPEQAAPQGGAAGAGGQVGNAAAPATSAPARSGVPSDSPFIDG